MSKYSELPIYRLNSFVEGRLRNEGIIPAESAYINDLDTSDNFGIPFMSPGAQQPELTTVFEEGAGFEDLPFCTYTWKQDRRSDMPWLRCGTVTYVFYSGDIDKLFEISNFIEDLCAREDRSAYDMNYYFRSDGTYPFDFKSINLVSGVGPNPTADEGGRYSYMCILGYDCTYEGTGRTDTYTSNGQLNIGMW